MAFIQPCFIRKNTPELRKKLEVLGYNQHPSYIENEQYLYLNRGFYHIDVIGYSEEIERMIDCGDNEDLFIAIASMTDDEIGLCDYYIVTDDCNMQYAKGSIYRALPLSSVIHPSCYRKATVEEIIEHFKKAMKE